ncbi:MAG: ABC transporter ATP-binding protein [Nanoarchaeota archaeon]|nr:ABC transporter ATP-binding protein [Nanoarchaeota archaeon]
MKIKDKKIHFKKNFKEYFKIVSKHKWLYSLMIFTVIITEILFISDKYLYKWLIDDAEKFIVGTLTQNAFLNITILIAGIFLGIVLIRSAMSWLNMHMIAVVEPKLIYDLKKKYFSHIIRLSHQFHSEHKSGKLISRLNRGAGAIESLTDVFVFQAGPVIVQFIFIFASIAIFSLKPALILAATMLVFVSYSLYLQNKQKRIQLEWNSSRDAESGFIADVLTNVESVKYFGAEKRILSRFKRFIFRSKIKGKKFWDTFSKMNSGQQLIMGIGTVAILYFPLMDFLNGKITIGTVVFIYSLYGMISGNLFRLMHGIRTFYRSMGDLEDLFRYGEVKNEIKDKSNAKEIKIEKGEIEFEKVYFGFKDKEKIFNNFNLKIKPNENVALIGHSGSGKTTVVKLLNRLYEVDSGSIKIDGKNIKEFKQESLRGATGLVPQEPILFDDTIYNNIKFSRPSAKREEVMAAMKFAQLDKLVEKFPKKENTIVGERGVKLSGGEKQRVSIARAILANRKILVLDEATSALDSATEHEIQKDLFRLLEGRTSLVIAHRLSTIMNSDRIIVMKEGKIVEQGKHSELIRKNGEYKRLWNLQKGGYIGG